jgi:hypothetical protein
MDPYPDYQLPSVDSFGSTQSIIPTTGLTMNKKPLSSAEIGVITVATAIAIITLCLLITLVRGK